MSNSATDIIRKPNVADVIADAMARENAMPDVTFTVPVVTVNELNAHEHWRVRQRRAMAQHVAVACAAAQQGVRDRLKGLFPCRVKFTRIAPSNGLDRGDNLNASFKHVKDFVCELIGTDDRNPLYEWDYDQRRGGKGEYAVIVEVTRIKGQ
jgi:hypothetical protein